MVFPALGFQRFQGRQAVNAHFRDIFHTVFRQFACQTVSIIILKGLSCTHIDISGQIVDIAVVGIIAGKPGRFLTIWALYLVNHTTVKAREHRSRGCRKHIGRLPCKVSKVSHVGKALLLGVSAVIFR
ncbi:hypothetical protein SDC9_185062 [bioreactor metagenome]|uniref:Uncharacterized protein n=1 Tax=bioreactor metagenome TaxID=1076179 RepID=A0A645HGM1_9ZZZZ